VRGLIARASGALIVGALLLGSVVPRPSLAAPMPRTSA